MRALLTALLVLIPTAAFAHPGHGDAVGFAAGFLHPMGGLDHILAMVAVGVFAFVLGGRALLLVPLSFVGMMAVGFLLGAGGVDVPFVELGIALSAVVIGGVAALGRPMPVAAATALVGAFAVFHGHAHGAEMPATESGLEFALGFMAATALLHLAGIGAAMGGAKLAGRVGRPLAQLAGGVFALVAASACSRAGSSPRLPGRFPLYARSLGLWPGPITSHNSVQTRPGGWDNILGKTPH